MLLLKQEQFKPKEKSTDELRWLDSCSLRRIDLNIPVISLNRLPCLHPLFFHDSPPRCHRRFHATNRVHFNRSSISSHQQEAHPEEEEDHPIEADQETTDRTTIEGALIAIAATEDETEADRPTAHPEAEADHRTVRPAPRLAVIPAVDQLPPLRRLPAHPNDQQRSNDYLTWPSDSRSCPANSLLHWRVRCLC